jgi:hypothetical protein
MKRFCKQDKTCIFVTKHSIECSIKTFLIEKKYFFKYNIGLKLNIKWELQK